MAIRRVAPEFASLCARCAYGQRMTCKSGETRTYCGALDTKQVPNDVRECGRFMQSTDMSAGQAVEQAYSLHRNPKGEVRFFHPETPGSEIREFITGRREEP